MIRIKLYIPQGPHVKEEQIKRLSELLVKYPKDSIEYSIEYLPTIEEQRRLKNDILLKISVTYRIKIAQTQKSKKLYPQLVVFIDDNPITFYPQKRRETTITIEEAFENITKGSLLTIHELPREIVSKLKMEGIKHEIKKR
jgi:hypothetical protein